MNVNSEIQVFNQIAKQSQYTLGNAFADLTGVGTLYSLGSDYAHEKRLEKMDVASKKISSFNMIVKEYLSSKNLSIVSKVAYLSALTLSAYGHAMGVNLLRNTGLISAFVVGAGFFARAGFNSTEQIQDDMRLAATVTSKEKTV